MKVSTKERTPQEAIAELRRLREQYGGLGKGKRGGLTLKIIAAEIGIRSTVTLHFWFSEGENHHAPQGVTMDNLCTFLDRAKDPAWIQKTIEKHAKAKRSK